MSAATVLGSYVTVGPGSVLRSCQIEDESIVGERCILMEGSLVRQLSPAVFLPFAPPQRPELSPYMGWGCVCALASQ